MSGGSLVDLGLKKESDTQLEKLTCKPSDAASNRLCSASASCFRSSASMRSSARSESRGSGHVRPLATILRCNSRATLRVLATSMRMLLS